jgi:hypothetical protein
MTGNVTAAVLLKPWSYWRFVFPPAGQQHPDRAGYLVRKRHDGDVRSPSRLHLEYPSRKSIAVAHCLLND